MSLSQTLESASLTDQGRVRPANEDSIFVRIETGVVVLADGMGGHNAGEVASHMAVDIIGERLHRAKSAASDISPPDREGGVAAARSLIVNEINRANLAVFQKSETDPECSGMGTTLVLGLFCGDTLTVAHIGDSRMYRLRDTRLQQLTRDHTLVQEQVDLGLIDSGLARAARHRHILTRALGTERAVATEMHNHKVMPGDLYLLCSDGLHDMVADEEIRLILLAAETDLQPTARLLVQAANANGGHDNISVILVRVAGIRRGR